MDSIIRSFIPNVMQFVEEYLATKGADAFLSLLKNQSRTTIQSVETQFVQCLDTALSKTCNHFGWEYDNHAIEQTFHYSDKLIKNSDDLQTALPEILSNAVGHPFSDYVQDFWMNCFVQAAVLPENQELYKIMIYYNTRNIQSRYSAKYIYGYLSKPFEQFIDNANWYKVENRLHGLVDYYCENDIVSSSAFQAYFQQHIQLILPKKVEGYSSGTFETDTYSALNVFYKTFSDSPNNTRDEAIQLIRTYMTYYLETLCEVNSVSPINKRDSVYSDINRIFVSFQEQMALSPIPQLSKVLLYKAKKTWDDFASILEKELPFEMEDGKKLRDVYVSPEYILLGQKVIRDNLFDLVNSFIERKIKSFLGKMGIMSQIEFGYYHILFVIGSGGMGKSSFLAKLAYDIRSKGVSLRIFFLKFSKLKDRSGNILDDIITQLSLSKNDLRQSVIVLDAYDEFLLDAAYNKDSVIQEFCSALCQLNALAIVTTRPGYINITAIGNSISVSLCTFSQKKRELWMRKYAPSINPEILQSVLNYQDISDERGGELIGTPIILYMVTANKLNISEFQSRYALYDKLFGNYGLWLNRRYDTNHPLLQNTQEEIYSLILDIALAIFNQRSGLSISRKSIEELIEKRNFENHELVITLKRCYPLITYFKSDMHLRELEFAHKSIYEFYVATKLSNEIDKILSMDMIYPNSVIEFAIRFKGDCLSNEIWKFYSEMIHQKQSPLPRYHQARKMLELLFANHFSILQNPLVSNSNYACNAFFNAFTAISKVLGAFLPSGYIEVPQNMLMECLRFYLNLSNYTGIVCLSHFNLEGLDFSHICCKNVDFSYANLENANLSCGDFTAASFYRANMRNVNLYAATLSRAILKEADLRGAFLRSVLLNKSDISIFTGLCLDVKQIQSFIPEIYNYYNLFRIYSNGKEMNTGEKENVIRDMWRFGISNN